MPHFSTRKCVRTSLLACSIVFSPALFADVFSQLPVLPPSNSIYFVPDTCVSVICLTDINLSDFVSLGSKIQGGNELTRSDVTLSADLFQNVGGQPGSPLGPIKLTGEADITYFNKGTLSGIGTFEDQLTALNLTGSFVGLTGQHTINAMLNPNMPSTGVTSIFLESPQPPGGKTTYEIHSFFDVFAELQLDGGPIVPGPERMATLGTPEPSYYGAMGCMFAALIAWLAYARKRATGQSNGA
jgi:hypothetical protein